MSTLQQGLKPGSASTHAWLGVLRGQPPFDSRIAGTYALLGIQGALTVMLAVALGFTYRGEGINDVLLVFAGTIAISATMRWRGLASLAAAAEAAVLLTLASMVAAVQCALLSTMGLAYRDPLLASADRLLFPFLNWPGMASWLAGQREVVGLMTFTYSSLLWQPYLLVVVLALAGRHAQLWRFIRAWALALMATVALFGVVPAVAPYLYYGFTQADRLT